MSDKINMAVVPLTEMPSESRDILRLWFTRKDGKSLANMVVVVRWVHLADASIEERARLNLVSELIGAYVNGAVTELTAKMDVAGEKEAT